MFNQIAALSLNGFSLKDVPFLLMQLSVSALLAIVIRYFWRKQNLSTNESSFLKYLMPVQIILTTLAVFSHQSPWMVVLFGLLSLIPLLGTEGFSLRSKAFYLMIVFIAFGCGAANLFVTGIVTVFLIVPSLYFYQSSSGNE